MTGTHAVALVMTAAAAGAAGIPAAEHAGTVAAGPADPAWWWSLMSSSPVWDCWPGHVCNDPVSNPQTSRHTQRHQRWWTSTMRTTGLGLNLACVSFFQALGAKSTTTTSTTNIKYQNLTRNVRKGKGTPFQHILVCRQLHYRQSIKKWSHSTSLKRRVPMAFLHSIVS